jgi:hypothetical protein
MMTKWIPEMYRALFVHLLTIFLILRFTTAVNPRSWRAALQDSTILPSLGTHFCPSTRETTLVTIPTVFLFLTTALLFTGLGYILGKQHQQEAAPSEHSPIELQPQEQDKNVITKVETIKETSTTTITSAIAEDQIKEEEQAEQSSSQQQQPNIPPAIEETENDVSIISSAQIESKIVELSSPIKYINTTTAADWVSHALAEIEQQTGVSTKKIDPVVLLQLIQKEKELQQKDTENRLRMYHIQTVVGLGTEANSISAERRDTERTSATNEADKELSRIEERRAEQLRSTAAEVFLCGILFMAAAGFQQASKLGFLKGIAATCTSFGGRGWGVWAAWRSANAVVCWASSLAYALTGVAVLIALVVLLYKTDFWGKNKDMPIFKLTVLGVFGGMAGYLLIIPALGGNADVWVVLWELWVVLHTGLVGAAKIIERQKIKKARTKAADAGGVPTLSGHYWGDGDEEETEGEKEEGGYLRLVMWTLGWVVLGFVIPVATAVLPFKYS